MLLAYVDESYTKKLLLPWGARDRVRRTGPLHRGRLDALILEFRESGAAAVASDVELHGKEIFHGQDGWSGVPVRARIAIYRRTMSVVRKSGARFIIRGMDCAKQRARYARPLPPHEVVLAHLLESLDGFAHKHNDHALVVADEVHTSERHRTKFGPDPGWWTQGYAAC